MARVVYEEYGPQTSLLATDAPLRHLIAFRSSHSGSSGLKLHHTACFNVVTIEKGMNTSYRRKIRNWFGKGSGTTLLQTCFSEGFQQLTPKLPLGKMMSATHNLGLILAFVLSLSSVSICAPLSRASPPSAEAVQLADTKFELVTGSESGCAEVITHAEVAEVPEGESEDVDGTIAFGSITVNGNECESGAEDQVLKLYAQDVLSSVLPDYIMDLPEEASRAIFIGGTDMTERRCGDWEDSEKQVYGFSNDISRLLPGLSGAGFIDNSTIAEETLVDGSMWMASAPQSGDGRFCLYVETSRLVEGAQAVGGEEEVAEGSPVPEEDTVVGAEAEEEDEEESEKGNETSGAAVFEEANNETIEADEAEATKEKRCFPGSAQVRLANGSTKRMDELRVGDRVHVTHCEHLFSVKSTVLLQAPNYSTATPVNEPFPIVAHHPAQGPNNTKKSIPHFCTSTGGRAPHLLPVSPSLVRKAFARPAGPPQTGPKHSATTSPACAPSTARKRCRCDSSTAHLARSLMRCLARFCFSTSTATRSQPSGTKSCSGPYHLGNRKMQMHSSVQCVVL